jgi:cell division protein FtsW (lipid II flippase)
MSWLRTTTTFTLLLFAATVAAGFVFGLVNRVVGLGHEWGVLDTAAVVRVLVTLAVALAVFCVLARKRHADYYSIGFGVVLFTAILSTLSAYALAPSGAREAYNWVGLAVWPLLFNVAALVLVGLFVRHRRSSSNTSLERTREG